LLAAHARLSPLLPPPPLSGQCSAPRPHLHSFPTRRSSDLTHTEKDPFNPDHPVASAVVQQARQLAAGAGVSSAFETVAPPALYFFEPHQREPCGFTPHTFLDITAVFEKKKEAMAAMASHTYLHSYYAELAQRR